MTNKENLESSSLDIQDKIITLLNQKENELILARDREKLYRTLLEECKKDRLVLKKSNEKYKILIEKIEQGVLLEDTEGFISFVNPRVEEMLGYKKEDILGKHWSSFVPSEELDKIQSEFAKRSDGIASTYESSLLTNDGRRIPVIITATPISTERGEFTRILTVLTDIKRLKKAEYSLKRSEELNRKLVDLFPDAITLTDLDANIIMVNKQAALVLGYDKQDELIGKNMYDLIEPSDHLQALKNTKRVLEKGIVRNTEYSLIKKNSDSFPAELSTTYITNDLGQPMAYMSTVKDISRRKEAQIERRRLEEKRRDFIDKTAHELRTPLTIIQGYAEQLLKQETENHKIHMLNKVLKNVNRLENLAISVSDIYRIEREDFTLTFDEINMHEFIISFLEPYFKQYKGHIQWIDSSCEDRVIIKGDPEKLKSVFTTVIENSIRNTESNNRKISLEMIVSEQKVRLVITDNGAGINPQKLEKIFEKYESIPTKYNVTGVGIGLYIAREIINAHNGSISAVSKGEDTGVKIVISLPILNN
ncbi:MAG: PAS domain S-box protein [Promethearchaeota archaeon]